MAINSLSTGWRPGVCTSSTRPTAPYEGQQIYETDTDKLLVWNGSAWIVVNGGTTTYQFAQTIYYTTVGTATFTKASYPWLRAIKVKCQGGGGGGAGAGSSGSAPAGGGGGYAESFITDIAGLASSITITVGGGGAGGAAGANAGANGSNSSFGSTVVGNGGVQSDTGNIRGGGSTGGTGDLIIFGQPGQGFFPTSQHTSMGGSSALGAGAQGNFSNINRAGNAGTGYGGGGGGGAYVNANTAGGAGSQGIVILELFA
jgi:hypothetical protein